MPTGREGERGTRWNELYLDRLDYWNTKDFPSFKPADKTGHISFTLGSYQKLLKALKLLEVISIDESEKSNERQSLGN